MCMHRNRATNIEPRRTGKSISQGRFGSANCSSRIMPVLTPQNTTSITTPATAPYGSNDRSNHSHEATEGIFSLLTPLYSILAFGWSGLWRCAGGVPPQRPPLSTHRTGSSPPSWHADSVYPPTPQMCLNASRNDATCFSRFRVQTMEPRQNKRATPFQSGSLTCSFGGCPVMPLDRSI